MEALGSVSQANLLLSRGGPLPAGGRSCCGLNAWGTGGQKKPMQMPRRSFQKLTRATLQRSVAAKDLQRSCRWLNLGQELGLLGTRQESATDSSLPSLRPLLKESTCLENAMKSRQDAQCLALEGALILRIGHLEGLIDVRTSARAQVLVACWSCPGSGQSSSCTGLGENCWL